MSIEPEKEVEQEVATEENPTCSEGYIWDDVLKKCVLDVG